MTKRRWYAENFKEENFRTDAPVPRLNDVTSFARNVSNTCYDLFKDVNIRGENELKTLNDYY